jgi:hypothetical protein
MGLYGRVPTTPRVERMTAASNATFKNPLLRRYGVFDYKVVLAHEIGHCNGWSADHAGARPLSEYN